MYTQLLSAFFPHNANYVNGMLFFVLLLSVLFFHIMRIMCTLKRMFAGKLHAPFFKAKNVANATSEAENSKNEKREFI